MVIIGNENYKYFSTVIFSGTAGNQTAMAYDDQQHGFFTYFLLKNPQSSKGAITLGDTWRSRTLLD